MTNHNAHRTIKLLMILQGTRSRVRLDELSNRLGQTEPVTRRTLDRLAAQGLVYPEEPRLTLPGLAVAAALHRGSMSYTCAA